MQADALRGWIKTSVPGECFCYHQGNLSIDIENAAVAAKRSDATVDVMRRDDLEEVRTVAYIAYTGGRFDLAQRRMRSAADGACDSFDYLIIHRHAVAEVVQPPQSVERSGHHTFHSRSLHVAVG